MGRPISKKYLGAIAPHQIQAYVWGINDAGTTSGYLNAQNSPHRFRATTVNGTSLTTLVNGPTNLVQGTSYVQVFPVGSYPTSYATANATLGATGNAVVVSGGQNYAVGDYLTFVGGTFTSAANVKILAVNASANNAIVTLSTPVQSLGGQKYTALPNNINAISTSTTGNGTGAVVTSDFGLDTSYVLTGGSGYTTANVHYEPAVSEPIITEPVVSGGVVTTGPITITNTGSFASFPNVTVEEETGSVEYVKTLTSQNYLNTYSNNQYKWLANGDPIPPDYANLAVKLAYLDTL